MEFSYLESVYIKSSARVYSTKERFHDSSEALVMAVTTRAEPLCHGRPVTLSTPCGWQVALFVTHVHVG